MKKSAILVLTLSLTLFANIASAGWRGHGGWHGGWVGPAFVGGVVGYGLASSYYPYYPYPYYAYPPAVVPPVVVAPASQPQIYVEQQPQALQPAVSAPPQNVWYHCEKPDGYYPYVKDCATGWQVVPATPPAPGVK
jgi:hypothetical protein